VPITMLAHGKLSNSGWTRRRAVTAESFEVSVGAAAGQPQCVRRTLLEVARRGKIVRTCIVRCLR
jgi:hypothetical protein